MNGFLYYTDSTGSDPSTGTGTIYKIPVGGGTPVAVVSGSGFFSDLEFVGTDIYYTVSDTQATMGIKKFTQ